MSAAIDTVLLALNICCSLGVRFGVRLRDGVEIQRKGSKDRGTFDRDDQLTHTVKRSMTYLIRPVVKVAGQSQCLLCVCEFFERLVREGEKTLAALHDQ